MAKSSTSFQQAVTLNFKIKEAVLALVVFGMGGSALAWGIYQAAPQRSPLPSPDEQCRVLANAIVGADSQILFASLNASDVKNLELTDHQMRAFQEEILSPRMASPFSWRPRQERIVSCEAQQGILAVPLTNPVGTQRNLLSLVVRNDQGRISFRYDDLLSMAVYLDRKSALTPAQMEERTRRDARAMAATGLPGFDQLHPGPKAVAILEEEKVRLAEEKKARALAVAQPGPAQNVKGAIERPANVVARPIPFQPMTE